MPQHLNVILNRIFNIIIYRTTVTYILYHNIYYIYHYRVPLKFIQYLGFIINKHFSINKLLLNLQDTLLTNKINYLLAR